MSHFLCCGVARVLRCQCGLEDAVAPSLPDIMFPHLEQGTWQGMAAPTRPNQTRRTLHTKCGRCGDIECQLCVVLALSLTCNLRFI